MKIGYKMSEDSFTEVTHTSWLSRLGESIKGILFGILFFLISIGLIIWNEGRSVDRIKTLEEGKGAVVPVSSEQVSNENEGALIHLSGKADTNEILQDAVFGVSEKALKLQRVVEMYQWHEKSRSKTKTNVGGSQTTETTYTYNKGWSENLIDSSSFNKPEGHKNPTKMPYQGERFVAKEIKIDAFNLGRPFVSQLSGYTGYKLTNENYKNMDNRLHKYLKLNAGKYLYGDPNNLKVGAVRVSYRIIKPTVISVVGRQSGDSVGAYNTKKW